MSTYVRKPFLLQRIASMLILIATILRSYNLVETQSVLSTNTQSDDETTWGK